MGCFPSKKESTDLHSNIFRVINIDENRADLCSGQLEITESDIILYREGRDSTVWPLHSLRRYGFEDDVFSFESGRRCETGEGIYAFKCRRASILFQKLQQQIQLRNVHDSISYPVPRLTPPPHGRPTLQTSVVHHSSADNGPSDSLGQIFTNNLTNVAHSGMPHALNQSPRSPSSADILEVMPLYPRTQGNSNHVTNVYQVRDFKREHNNNQSEMAAENRHVYTNDFNRDLAILRTTLKQEMALNTLRDMEDETRFLESRYLSENIQIRSEFIMNQKEASNNPLSPTISNSSDHYTQLTIEQQEPSRLYVNVAPNDSNIFDTSKNDPIAKTPLTPKPVEYCNLIIGARPALNVYANLTLGDIADGDQNTQPFFNNSEHNQKYSESGAFASISTVEDLNYAVLDIDSNKDSIETVKDVIASPESQSFNSSKNESTGCYSSQLRSRMVSQASTDRTTSTNTCNPVPSANIGYTTIDFEKTVALTSVAAGAEINNMEGSRKHRQNSCSVLNGSPNTGEKCRGNN